MSQNQKPLRPITDRHGTSAANAPGPIPGDAPDASCEALTPILDQALAPLFWRSQLLDNVSAWFGHIPFAHWVIRATRPRVFVELGTHAGVSYAAFCLAAQQEQTGTRCFAVDTWKGDPHASFYPERVYQDLNEFNQQHYAHFSTLCRCTFDDALERFDDGSIDLLHIDGYHTYDAVSHDFSSWLPKLSKRAVILFHDTNEHREGFGVWKFWSEVRQRYPSFDFLHSHGLGVLAVGEDTAPAIADLCALRHDDIQAAIVRARFQFFGDRWVGEAKARRDQKQAQDKQRQMAQDHAKALQQAREDAAAQLRTAKNEAGQHVKAAQHQQQQSEKALRDAERALRDAQRREQAQARRAALLEGERREILASTSWWLTAPLRGAANIMPHAVRKPASRVAHVTRRALSPATLPNMLRQRAAYKCLDASPMFDKDWYLAQYPDVAAAGADPVRHYICSGAAEGRNPSREFDTRFYLARHPDVAAARINPLQHYIKFGRHESRLTKQRQFFDHEASKAWQDALLASAAAARVRQRQPLVSIILPTRDRARLLPNAIGSVMAQTYAHWELIIIDDGSTDGTADLIKTRHTDSRITLLHTEGQGVCHARNTGLDHAGGDVVAYLDSDNTWTPQYLELMLCQLERSGADCAYAALQVNDGTINGITARPWYRCDPFDYDELKQSNYIDLNVFMHKKALFDSLDGFDTTLRRMVDWDLILRYCHNHPASFANFVGASYDNGHAVDRITNREGLAWKNVIRNRHLIDWDEQVAALPQRDPDLVSVVVCVYGQMEITEACLQSLHTHEPGCRMELILVDNGSDPSTAQRLDDWKALHPDVVVIHNHENYNFALGCNLGFAASRGARVVFLNNDTEVTPEWLRALVYPLRDPRILGTQPKLLYADGTIQCVGVVFPEQSPMGYPIYANQPGDFPPTQQPRNFAAITAACLAMRADDFARARGFDPLYVNGQEDLDLCMRLGEGTPVFRYVPDSVVVHHESKTPGRGANIEPNRKLFHERWKDCVVADDQSHYQADDMRATDYEPDQSDWVEPGYAAWKPRILSARKPQQGNGRTATHVALNDRTIAIKIGCPRAELKDHWGDYHFAVALAAAFCRKGVKARIDFLEQWRNVDGPDDEINLVLRGLSPFAPQRNALNLMWLISHPDSVTPDEMRAYDHVFVASEAWMKTLPRHSSVVAEPLLQCTDSCRFHPDNVDESVQTSALFVANSRRVLRPVVRDAVAQNMEIDIYGEMWEGLAPDDWVKGTKIDNVDLPRYYASARVVLNDHWDSMREQGFVSNRIFDVLACGAPLITDRVAGLPAPIAEHVHFFDDDTPLREQVERHARPAGKIVPNRTASDYIRRHHSFDARADRILAVMQQKLHRLGVATS